MSVQNIRERFFPHIWCPGCGHGTILNNLLHAVQDMNIDPSNMCMVSGIGCSARISGYVDFHSMHTMHGRALACATGIKMTKPELNVVVPMGDGDAMAIGGNHFIHACRRNVDITLVVVNNCIYGMTSGQFSPMTPTGKFATTAVYGNIDRPFDLVNLAGGAGATYVARGSVYHAMQTKNYIKHAIEHKGFSVVECLSTCPTYYGRRNKIGDAVSMMERLRDDCTMLKPGVTEYDKPFVIGEFVNKEAKEYTEAYDEVIMKAGGKK